LGIVQPQPPLRVETVVKFGGGLLAHVEHFEATLATIGVAATSRPLLIVPGGGPFADAVRDADRRLGLSDAAAHWMAVLAMDQYAQVIAEKLPRAVIVTEPRQIADALSARPVAHIPVLAPYRWLRETDPLPHSWQVTSDSIAAWVAGRVGARRLVLVKPPGATGRGAVDTYFAQALPAHITPLIVPADCIDSLATALGA
jgi:5-(aminomethyl)-3-furanmethanol phosphate kinase